MDATRVEVQGYLIGLSKELNVATTDPAFALVLDSRDPLSKFRENLNIPSIAELVGGKETAPGFFSIIVKH